MMQPLALVAPLKLVGPVPEIATLVRGAPAAFWTETCRAPRLAAVEPVGGAITLSSTTGGRVPIEGQVIAERILT